MKKNTNTYYHLICIIDIYYILTVQLKINMDCKTIRSCKHSTIYLVLHLSFIPRCDYAAQTFQVCRIEKGHKWNEMNTLNSLLSRHVHSNALSPLIHHSPAWEVAEVSEPGGGLMEPKRWLVPRVGSWSYRKSSRVKLSVAPVLSLAQALLCEQTVLFMCLIVGVWPWLWGWNVGSFKVCWISFFCARLCFPKVSIQIISLISSYFHCTFLFCPPVFGFAGCFSNLMFSCGCWKMDLAAGCLPIVPLQSNYHRDVNIPEGHPSREGLKTLLSSLWSSSNSHENRW